jgi:hypothetical protein
VGVPVSKLNRVHPDYALFSDAWNDIEILNAGGVRMKAAAQQFLIKRPKEMFDVYSERIKRITQDNILGTVLGWYSSALFKRNPQIDIKGGDEKWYTEEFLVDCDQQRTTFVDIFRDVFKYLFLYQSAFILTDLPHPEVAPLSRADEQAQGLDQPYLICYRPTDAINWANDDRGNLLWIVFRTMELAGDFLDEPAIVTRWYYFDRTKYQVYEDKSTRPTTEGAIPPALFDPSGNLVDSQSKDAELMSEGEHALAKLNRVPVTRVRVPDELWMANRIYLQLIDHINQDNSLAWALFNGNMAMPIIFSDNPPKNLTLSEVSWLNLGEKDKFEWAEPKGQSYGYSEKRLSSQREEIYRSVHLQAQGRSSAATPAAQSGYSKELDMMPSNEVLNRYGDVLRAGMQQTGEIVSLMRGDKATWDVFGFKFETKPVTESVAVAQEMQDLGLFDASPTLEKEAMKAVANDFLEDRNDDIKKKVAAEIDAAPTAAERDAAQVKAQQQAFEQSFNRIGTRQEVQGEMGTLAA